MTDTHELIADTLLLMRIHDQLEEFGGCQFWTGATNGQAGHPHCKRGPVRRVLWQLTRGSIPDKLLVTTTCGNVKCLACLALVTKGEVSRKSMANPITKLKRRAAAARTNRPKMGKITMQDARDIRASAKTGRVLALQYGVSQSLISCVRTRRSWVEFTGNPFAGLMQK